MKHFSESLPFYKANFHCHTTESDGHLSPAAVADFYKNAGYDILALTDHRKVTHISRDDLLMVPGIEIDYRLTGQWVHILGLGMNDEITDRWNRFGTPQEGIDLIRSLGGIAVLAHPAWSLNTPAFMRSLTGLSGVEIWNSVSTLPLNGDRADSSSLLDVTWASGGELLPVFANDDSHQYETEAGVAATMVQAEELSFSSVMRALKDGHFYATTGPEIHQIEIKNYQELIVSCSPAESVIFYSDCPWAEGRSIIKPGMTECNYFIQKSDHFVRIEVRDKAGRKAWSAPIKIR
ncbi:MAG: CehA/McbA family metallohydrolase [Clostridia bacterium]|nr:CehA/McbA family metallohydrolase [Clostridia bacterium]